jgi:methylamine dehydrogenase accessory protein MauD
MDWTGWLLISHLVLWAVVVVQVVLILALARLVGQLNRRILPSGARIIDPGPEIGETLEEWEGTDLLSRTVSFRFPRERGIFLLYISPHCSACAWLLPAARRFFKEITVEAEGIWILTRGEQATRVAYARENRLDQHIVLAEEEIPRSWRVGGGPFGLWVNATGKVQTKGMVNNREHLESLRHASDIGHPSLESYVAAVAGDEEEAVQAD